MNLWEDKKKKYLVELKKIIELINSEFQIRKISDKYNG